jgi:hypothetical protein
MGMPHADRAVKAAYQAVYRTKNREKCAVYAARYRALHVESIAANKRAGVLRRNFGFTPEQYDALFREQKGMCAICGQPPKMVRLGVDHDHRTGIVRSLLCVKCNNALGWLESGDWLKKALTYLERHRCHQ